MKKIFLLLLIPTMLYCDGKPQIKFDTLTHDFGKQKQNSELKYTFTFTNIGKGTLIIEKITAGWGCTGVLLSKKDIPAGGSGQIEITLKTGTHTGKVTKSITVNTNDPSLKEIKLVINADVQ